MLISTSPTTALLLTSNNWISKRLRTESSCPERPSRKPRKPRNKLKKISDSIYTKEEWFQGTPFELLTSMTPMWKLVVELIVTQLGKWDGLRF